MPVTHIRPHKLTFARRDDGDLDLSEGALARIATAIYERRQSGALSRAPVSAVTAAERELIRLVRDHTETRGMHAADALKRVTRDHPGLLALSRCEVCDDGDPSAVAW